MKFRLLLVLLLLCAGCTALQAQSMVVPDDLSGTDWSQIQAQIEASRYHAQPGDDPADGWHARNPAHGFQIGYGTDGRTVLALEGEDSADVWAALRLRGYGYGEQLIEVMNAPELSVNGSTVTYRWKPDLREWWVNSERGVEQWFELAKRPAVARDGQPLVMAMALDTELNVQLQDNVLTLSSADGATKVTYDRLKVWDSTGRILAASMHLQDNRLALHIDDAHAIYPVTIDPTFSQQAYLKASGIDADDQFGWSVAISGDTVVVGSWREASAATGINGDSSDNSAGLAGAAYVFVRDGSDNWSQQAYLKASNNPSFGGIGFGWSVAIDEDTVVVGAPFEPSSATGVNGDQNDIRSSAAGAAYVFVRDAANVWSQQAYLKASNTNSGDQFGEGVAISGNTIVVGAPSERSQATGVNGNQNDNSGFFSGAAYVFVRDGAGVWSQQAYLKSADNSNNGFFGDVFGRSVAVDNDTIVVGAAFEDSSAIGVNGDSGNNAARDAGAAYVFVRNGVGVWSPQAYLKASNTDSGDQFGNSVAIDGDSIVVGALSENGGATGINGDQADNTAVSAGAAYVFVRGAGNTWTQQAYLKASNTNSRDQFGTSVSIAGNTVAVSAFSEDSAATGVNGNQNNNSAGDSGAVYVFTREAGVWSQHAYLKASNTDPGDSLGWSVATTEDAVVAGAVGESSAGFNQADDSAASAGAAYVFGLSSVLFSVGGNVSGLSGSGLVLQNNGGDDLPIGADGAFTFSTAVNDGSGFAVTVLTQPSAPSQTCSVSNGVGTVNGADVTDIQITCTINTFTIGGNVSGLSGSGLVLQNNGGDDLPITADGSFTFATPLNDGSTYSVTVATQPTGPNQTCSVVNASGTVSGANVTDVQITCITDQFTVGGTVSGLVGDGLELQNNAGNDLPIAANGPFTFPAQNDGTTYTVTVANQPTAPSQTCSVINGAGTVSGADITDVQITCVTDTFSIGGMVSGLGGTGLVLQNNGSDDLPIAADGAFTFAAELDDGSAYSVTVATQPTSPNQTCSVSNGDDTLSGADVVDVQIDCVTDTFIIGGTVSGLNGTGLVLQNNGGDDLSITTDGPFAFATPLSDGSDYAVTVLSQPVTGRDQQCTVVNGSGTLMGADANDVAVLCQDIVIGLSVTDLDLGLIFIGAQGNAAITLTNTGQPDLVITDITSPSAPFAIDGGDCMNLPLTLSADQSCQIDIMFSPTAAGTFNDSLQITSNATSSPDTVRLSGTASFEPLIVPTLNAWPLFILALLLGMIGVIASRRFARE